MKKEKLRHGQVSALTSAAWSKNKMGEKQLYGAIRYWHDGMHRKLMIFDLLKFDIDTLENAQILTGLLALSLLPNKNHELRRVYNPNNSSVLQLRKLAEDFQPIAGLNENSPLFLSAKKEVERTGVVPDFYRSNGEAAQYMRGLAAKGSGFNGCDVAVYIPDDIETKMIADGAYKWDDFAL